MAAQYIIDPAFKCEVVETDPTEEYLDESDTGHEGMFAFLYIS